MPGGFEKSLLPGFFHTLKYHKFMPNSYAKYCPNVWVAKCEQEYQKGEVIQVETKYGRENACIVFNLVAKKDGFFYYSIVREDGFDSRTWAENRAKRLQGAANNAHKKSTEYYEASNEGRDFLVLAEPIKVGHHSEKRHRALIERNHNRMRKSVEASDKADAYQERAAYWESRAKDINLSMPDSIGYYEHKLEQATREHEDLKNNPEKRSHSFSLPYAKKAVNEAKKNLETALKLWGETE